MATGTLQCSLKPFPIVYLGLPLTPGRLRRADLWPIVDKYSKKMAGWQPRLLAPSGRLTLIRSVLMALPIHLLSVMPLPTWVLKILNRKCRGFLWRGEEDINGGHCLLPWSRVCTPTSKGGLGILNLQLFGVALRCRWPWLLWADSPRPWCFVLEQDREATALFRTGARIILRSGDRVLFWHDRWLPGGLAVPDLVPALASFVRKSITVEQALVNNRWVRDISGGLSAAALAQYFKLWDAVTATSLTAGQRDEVVWRFETSGEFSTSSAYSLFFAGNIDFACASAIWKAKAPPRLKFFMWLVVHQRCQTADNLERKGWPNQGACVLCSQESESCRHLFLHCCFTREVWERFRNWVGAPFPIPGPTMQTRRPGGFGQERQPQSS